MARTLIAVVRLSLLLLLAIPCLWAASAQAQIVATQIGVGTGYVCALTAAGGVKCWQTPATVTPTNFKGILGHGLTTGSLTPVDVVGLTSGVTAISVGATHACALLASGGVKCWGDNQYSTLGDPSLGTVNSNYTNQTFSNVPVQVSGLTSGVTAISAGTTSTCALLSDTSVQCWGKDIPYYTAATGANSNVPIAATGYSTGVLSISTGEAHFCAVMVGGAVRCARHNFFAGYGMSFTVPQEYTGFDLTTFGTGNLKVETRAFHVCAITATNGVKCWGAGINGQLGNGASANSITAVDVTGLSSGVTAIGPSSTHANGGSGSTCAVVSGAVKCWGYNGAYGQLGDGTTTNRLSPVQTVGITSGAIAVDGESSRTCALMANGSIKCWGADYGTTAVGVPGFGGTVPSAPLNPAGTSGNGSISVSFDAPASDGGAPVIGYKVTCVNGATTITATGTGSPINVTGLTNGLPYTCNVQAQNSIGLGAASTLVGPFTPSQPVQIITFNQPPSPVAYSVGLTFAVTATTTSTSPVVLTSGTPLVCTVSAGVVTVVKPGVCVINANAAADGTYAAAVQVSRSIVIRAVCSLDIDQDGLILPQTDGLLILRRMLGLSNVALKSNAFNPAGLRLDAGDMANAIDPMIDGQTLDIDGNGGVAASTDGVLLLRALFGFGGASVTSDALGGTPRARGDWPSIRNYLVTECGLVNLAP